MPAQSVSRDPGPSQHLPPEPPAFVLTSAATVSPSDPSHTWTPQGSAHGMATLTQTPLISHTRRPQATGSLRLTGSREGA